MEDMVLTYVYYKWEEVHPSGIKGTNPDRYMENLRLIVDGGYFPAVTYAGQMNATCGGTENFGAHYGFIILADKETTRSILNLIEFDVSESFIYETMEKTNKDLEGIEDKIAAM